VSGWTVIRFLHIVGIVLFVGGQLTLVLAITPVLRTTTDGAAAMRRIARRFGVASAVALAVVIVTGAAMASHLSLWHDSTLQAKLGVLVLVAVLTGLHITSTETRVISIALVLCSLLIVWLGVKLTYG